jgi:hypothetical protein
LSQLPDDALIEQVRARLIHLKKGPFSNMDSRRGSMCLKLLTRILANAPVKRMYVAIDNENLKAKHAVAGT